jgi:hypothetical protein
VFLRGDGAEKRAEDLRGGRTEQVFLRVKAGCQFGRIGLYFKAGPGFLTQPKGAISLNRERSGCIDTVLSTCFDNKYTINAARSRSIFRNTPSFASMQAACLLESGSVPQQLQTVFRLRR